MKEQDRRFYLFGDLDGMTIGHLKELLSDYNDSDIIDGRTEQEFGGFGTGPIETEYFVIMRKEENEMPPVIDRGNHEV